MEETLLPGKCGEMKGLRTPTNHLLASGKSHFLISMVRNFLQRLSCVNLNWLLPVPCRWTDLGSVCTSQSCALSHLKMDITELLLITQRERVLLPWECSGKIFVSLCGYLFKSHNFVQLTRILWVNFQRKKFSVAWCSMSLICVSCRFPNNPGYITWPRVW